LEIDRNILGSMSRTGNSDTLRLTIL